jgi:hypothetical protein
MVIFNKTEKTAEELIAQTIHWLDKLEKKKIELKSPSKESEEQLTNIQAYVSDCKHFLEQKDFIRAFEAVIYAWGIAETLERLGMLTEAWDSE